MQVSSSVQPENRIVSFLNFLHFCFRQLLKFKQGFPVDKIVPLVIKYIRKPQCMGHFVHGQVTAIVQVVETRPEIIPRQHDGTSSIYFALVILPGERRIILLGIQDDGFKMLKIQIGITVSKLNDRSCYQHPHFVSYFFDVFAGPEIFHPDKPAYPPLEFPPSVFAKHFVNHKIVHQQLPVVLVGTLPENRPAVSPHQKIEMCIPKQEKQQVKHNSGNNSKKYDFHVRVYSAARYSKSWLVISIADNS